MTPENIVFLIETKSLDLQNKLDDAHDQLEKIRKSFETYMFEMEKVIEELKSESPESSRTAE